MKNVLRVVLIALVIMLSATNISASEVPVAESSINADLDNARIVLNEIPMKVRTIETGWRVYVSIADVIDYFGGNLQVDEKNKFINIIPAASDNPSVNNEILLEPKKSENIRVGLDTYGITYEGLNVYLNTIEYQDSVYVSIRYLAEIFNKKIEYTEEGVIKITDLPETVIGVVNNENITLRELEYFYNPRVKNLDGNTPNSEEQKNQLKQDIFNYLVELKLVLQKAQQENLYLTAEELAAINTESLDPIVESYGGIDEFRKLLAENDTYFSQIILNYRESCLYNKTINKFIEKVNVSEETIQKYYEDNKSSLVEPEKVTAKHILIRTMDDTGTAFTSEKKEEARKKAEDILNKIKAGEDFDSLMNMYSEDPGSAQSPEGFTFTRGDMIKEFEDAAFSMEPGEVSPIVETVYGYHIIKTMDRIPQKQIAYEEIKDQIQMELNQIEKQEYYNNLISLWKLESEIENIIE